MDQEPEPVEIAAPAPAQAVSPEARAAEKLGERIAARVKARGKVYDGDRGWLR